MDLNALPFVPCNHRTPRAGRCDLIVVHTNEGPPGPSTAEGLASYLQHVDPGYNVVIDENSAVMTAHLNEVVWGAGGVNGRAVHFCVTGRAAQTTADWDAPSERAAVGILADLVLQASNALSIPFQRITDSRSPNRGVCGHGDVSRYFPASMGHTDPGPNFPWDRIFSPHPLPAQEDEVFRIIKGDKTNDLWLTNWLTKRRIADAAEQSEIVKAGITNGDPGIVWPQRLVDNIPVET